MARPQQNLPRAFRTSAHAPAKPSGTRRLPARVVVALAILLLAVAAAMLVHLLTRVSADSVVDRDVTRLFAGIPQHDSVLGAATAPVTLEIYIDLKDPDSRNYFLQYLPAIVDRYVRTGALRLIYHAYKTNTFRPQEFIGEQTAALAAGAQNKLWNYIDTFFHDQGSEFRGYVSESFLQGIARQIPHLSLVQWDEDRHTGRREEQTAAEDQVARSLHLHVTPSFRIGLTGQTMHNFAGHSIVKYGEQHPIALPTVEDIGQGIQKLEHGVSPARSSR